MESLGIHILAEYSGCDEIFLNDVSYIENKMHESALISGATIISSSFHHFSPYGVSGVIVIQESHLAIHTWPEYQFASVDIFTCGNTVEPWKAYEFLKVALNAKNGTAFKMSRGTNLVSPEVKIPEGIDKNKKVLNHENNQFKKDSWITIRETDTALSFKYSGEKLYDDRLNVNHIELYNSHAFGKILLLNGRILLTEKDGYKYHEMLVHPAMAQFDGRVDTLILGPSTYGSANELLKYGSEKVSVTVLDNNPMISEAINKNFPQIYKAMFNQRVNRLEIENEEYINNSSDESYDLIIGENLFIDNANQYSTELLKGILRILKNNGILIYSLGSIEYNNCEIHPLSEALILNFGIEAIYFYGVNLISGYPGTFYFAICIKNQSKPIKTDQNSLNLNQDVISKYKYYNLESHEDSFNCCKHLKNDYFSKKGEKIGSKIDFL